MKVAVIGTGAAGYAAISTLSEVISNLDLFVFDPDGTTPTAAELQLGQKDHRLWSAEDFELVHEAIKAEVGSSFPPPKSNFGKQIPKRDAKIPRELPMAKEPGGLTNYWSSSLFPFSDADFLGSSVTLADLKPFYRKIADRVGIAGRRDMWDDFFGDTYITRPPVEATELAEGLIDALKDGKGSPNGIVAGLNRLGIETRQEESTCCVQCGGCFYGCYRGSILNAATALKREGLDSGYQRIPETVSKIESSRSSLTVVTESDRHSGFDKVFCAAGCIASNEIALRSLGGAGDRLVFHDNDIFSFPIFYFGNALNTDLDRYTAIANVALGFPPDRHNDPFAMAQIAPVPDYLLRFYIPSQFARYAIFAARKLRARILLAKLFVDGRTSPRVAIELDNKAGAKFELVESGRSKEAVRRVMSRLRQHLKGSPFFVPPFPPIALSTSYHYAGGLTGMDTPLALPSNGQAARGTYFVDSSVLANSPAQPLTFTIMANAARIVTEAADG